MKIKRKCIYCNKIKEIHFEKNPPICDDCLRLIKHDKHYLIKLIILMIIILIIFILSLLIT